MDPLGAEPGQPMDELLTQARDGLAWLAAREAFSDIAEIAAIIGARRRRILLEQYMAARQSIANFPATPSGQAQP